MTDAPKPQRTRKAKPAAPASAAPTAAPAQVAPSAHLAIALMNAPKAEGSPSLAFAQQHAVEPARYTAHEREQMTTMANDFNALGRDALTFIENTGFPGFPALALLSQLAEYRAMCEPLADECVRKWGRVTTSGQTPPDRIRDVEALLEQLDVKATIRQGVVHDQMFGGMHIFLKMKGDDDQLMIPLVARPYTVRKGSFEGVRAIEPYWVTPNNYNATDPTKADFFKPTSWWALSREVHSTRLITCVSRPVSDMLKPAYSFRGVSMTQLAMPYVDNWLRTRQSVSDTVKQFSVSGILTDLQQALLPGAGADLAMRASLINAYRDNRNLLFLDKATEEFFQTNTPLTTLDALQAQAQEQMSAVSTIPLVKAFGITPVGLNASSDGEIRVWYDRVGGYQRNVLGSLMERILDLAQLSLFGQIDEHLCWEWNPLHELTSLEEAERRARDATTDQAYIEAMVLDPEQVKERLANDPTSGYSGILNKPASPDDFDDTDIAGITEELLQPMAEEATNGIADTTPVAAMDEWTEGDHPRADNGQFGSGGAAGKKAAPLTGAALSREVNRQAVAGWSKAIGESGQFALGKDYPVIIDVNGRKQKFAAFKKSGGGPLHLTALANTKDGPSFQTYKLGKGGNLEYVGERFLGAHTEEARTAQLETFNNLFED